MPIEHVASFRPAWYIRGPHRQTIAVNLFRRPTFIEPQRERIETSDGDFFDIDKYQQGSRKCLIVAHGLEGDSRKQYVRGIIKQMYSEGWDGIGLNYRGCSGELNRLPRSYHCGDNDDLELLLKQLVAAETYDTIVLAGFSLGANAVLLLAGQAGEALPKEIKAVVGVSVPMDLASSIANIDRKRNWHYVYKFLITLRAKALKKIKLGILDSSFESKVRRARNFTQFDHVYTAPLHGFSSGKDYWHEVSALPVMEAIKVPSLVINAQDDTFLSEKCFPSHLAKDNKLIHLVIPRYGGHVGFVNKLPWDTLWTDHKIKSFLLDQLSL